MTSPQTPCRDGISANRFGQGEGVTEFTAMKNIQAAIQEDFPAVVGDDVPGP